LSQNANTRLRQLKADKEFKKIFYKCLSGCVTEEEFEQNWNTMVNKYNLHEHDWFKRLYSIREKWCTALSKDFFSAGILSSQRSESTNHAVGFKANKTTTLTEFFSVFQATVNRWRREEEKDDFNCTKGLPSSDLCMSSLLKHASMVYTHTLFRDFEEEFKYAMASDVQFLFGDGNSLIIKYLSMVSKGLIIQYAYDIHKKQSNVDVKILRSLVGYASIVLELCTFILFIQSQNNIFLQDGPSLQIKKFGRSVTSNRRIEEN